MRRLWCYYIYLLVGWGGFRYLVQLPEVIDELWFKPLIWLVPLFWWSLALRDRVVMFGKRWTASVALGLVAGIFYYLLIRKLTWSDGWGVDVWAIAVATAITEEMTFSGFVAGYLDKVRLGKVGNLMIVGTMVAVMRLPILLLVYNLGLAEVLGAFLWAGASGAINAWIRVKTGNVTGSILARLGMNLAVLG